MDAIENNQSQSSSTNKKKLSKKISKRRRQKLKYDKAVRNYTEFMEKHVDQVHQPNVGSHPLYYISNKEYSRLKNNAIILCSPTIQKNSGDNRRVQYSIEEIGKNLEFKSMPNGNMSINCNRMTMNSFYILIRSSELSNFESIDLH